MTNIIRFNCPCGSEQCKIYNDNGRICFKCFECPKGIIHDFNDIIDNNVKD